MIGKTGGNWKKNQWGKVLLLGKHSDVNEKKMKEKYLLRKTMNCNDIISLFTINKWLVRASWKTLQACRGRHLSIKAYHSEKLLNVLFRNWKQCITIKKRISVICIAMHSKSQIFFAGSINKSRTWKWFTETFYSVWLLLHADSLTHFFSSFIMELTAKIHLRLP